MFKLIKSYLKGLADSHFPSDIPVPVVVEQPRTPTKYNKYSVNVGRCTITYYFKNGNAESRQVDGDPFPERTTDVKDYAMAHLGTEMRNNQIHIKHGEIDYFYKYEDVEHIELSYSALYKDDIFSEDLDSVISKDGRFTLVKSDVPC